MTAESNVSFWPNPGNAGDSLIHAGTLDALASWGVHFQVITAPDDVPEDGVVILSGGGNLVPLYPHMADQIKACRARGVGRLLILPHTIRGSEDTLALLGVRDVVCCRDRRSAAHVRAVAPSTQAILSHDMAFHLNAGRLLRDRSLSKRGKRVLQERLAQHDWDLRMLRRHSLVRLLRRDAEALDGGPPTHLDLSLALMNPDVGGWPSRLDAWCFLEAIRHCRRIVTDRLHVAIGACLVGVPVTLLPNSYDKNVSVYQYSLRGLPGVSWRNVYDAS